MAGQGENARSLAYSETISPTLKGASSGSNQTPSVLCVEPEIARTLTARHDSSPCVDRGQNVVAIHQNQIGELRESNVACTLSTNANATERNAPLIAFAQNQRNELRDLNDVAGCLASEPGMKQQTYIAQLPEDCLTPWDKQQSRINSPDGIAPTLVGADMGGGRNPAGLVMTEVHPEITSTLLASGAGTSRTGGMGSETDFTIAYCLQGNMIGRADHNGPAGSGVNSEISFTLNTADKHAVAAVDCRNLYENDELSGTLTAKETGGYSLNHQNPVRTGYVIRRLTPTECERLMSFDDGYTAYGHDGKQMSDSARYSMLGNSIVVNVLAYIMQNVAERLGRENIPE